MCILSVFRGLPSYEGSYILAGKCSMAANISLKLISFYADSSLSYILKYYSQLNARSLFLLPSTGITIFLPLLASAIFADYFAISLGNKNH
jgi:hypothetical protein